jgi:hypothetical protein
LDLFSSALCNNGRAQQAFIRDCPTNLPWLQTGVLGIQNFEFGDSSHDYFFNLGHACNFHALREEVNHCLDARSLETIMHELDDLAAPQKKRNPLVLVGKLLSLATTKYR